MNRVRERGCHNWDRRSGILCRDRLTSSGGKDDLGFEPDQLPRQGWQPLCITISVTVDDIEVAALDVTELSHPLQKGVDKPYGGTTSASTQPGNEWPLLRAPRERPCGRRAAEQRYELTPFHCRVPPVPPTERIAHLARADCCIHPPGRYETIAVTPPKIFSKEVAQKQATPFPCQDLLTARNRLRPNFRG